MTDGRRRFGNAGENLAVWYLRKIGYTILEQNYSTRVGEIDIVAREKDTIVFIEVKTRRTSGFGSPKTAVTPRKQRKISMVALWYLKATDQCRSKARFDVIAIDAKEGNPRIEIIKNAFELRYP
jgi:putative endonuclease